MRGSEKKWMHVLAIAKNFCWMLHLISSGCFGLGSRMREFKNTNHSGLGKSIGDVSPAKFRPSMNHLIEARCKRFHTENADLLWGLKWIPAGFRIESRLVFESDIQLFLLPFAHIHSFSPRSFFIPLPPAPSHSWDMLDRVPRVDCCTCIIRRIDNNRHRVEVKNESPGAITPYISN